MLVERVETVCDFCEDPGIEREEIKIGRLRRKPDACDSCYETLVKPLHEALAAIPTQRRRT